MKTKTRSLAGRVTIQTLLATFTLLICFWCVLYFSLVQSLEVQDRLVLTDRIGTLRTLLGSPTENWMRLKNRVESEWSTRSFERIYVRISDSSGKLLTESPLIPADLRESFETLQSENFRKKTSRPKRIEIGAQVFWVTNANIIVPGKQDADYHVTIMLDRTSEEGLLQSFRATLIYVATIGIFVCWLIGRAAGRSALGPVRHISQMAARVSSARLSERVETERLPAEFVQLGNTLNEMLARLDESFSRLSRFSSDMAHELRTPLNNMLGSFQVTLGKERDPEAYQSALVLGVEECERLSGIIDALLFIARAEDPRQEIKKQEIDLNEEIQNIVDYYQVLAETTSTVIKYSGFAEPKILAERTLFQRALSNLISNACVHNPAGTVVNVSSIDTDGRTYITVEDSGRGIGAESIQRVAERFFREDESRTKVTGGSGLGLSIVQGIVRMHGGDLKITSEPKVGTKITIDFETV